MLDLDKIPEFFPMTDFREGQKECIEFILNAFNEGKRCVVLEAPTGSGKSAIGLTVAQFFGSSFYLTIQKILQSQIITDFDDKLDIVDLKGRATYRCTYYQRHGAKLVAGRALTEKKLNALTRAYIDCNSGHCRKREKAYRSQLCFPHVEGTPTSKFNGSLHELPTGMSYSACPYYEQVYRAANADVALMNFSSFLYQKNMTNRFPRRDLMIIDEAHQTEPQLLDFISLTISDELLQKVGFTLPEFKTPEEYWLYFVEQKLEDKLGGIIRDAKEADDLKTMDNYMNTLKKLLKFMKYMERQDEWIAEFAKHKDYNSVQLKPVFVKEKSHDILLDHGAKLLMMSATILDVGIFCSSLGIDRKDVAAYRMANRFPVENRPIYMRSVGKITGGPSKMPQWGPKIVEETDKILDEHHDDRGIIHTHNFAIANMLMQKSKHKSRLMFQGNFKTKDVMLRKHATSSAGVIVAPAMHEGLDLVDDLSRFQIICKVPWPNLYDDKQLARRVEVDRDYYVWLTALKLVQSAGRSVRSVEDWANTYVLDEVFRRFMRDASRMIPGWFKEAVIFEE